jgi:predicted ArsR family transcriptional regulator
MPSDTLTDAELQKNRTRREIEKRVLDVVRNADIPPLVSDVARRARVNNVQARRALTALIADGKIVEIWDQQRETEAYDLPERP